MTKTATKEIDNTQHGNAKFPLVEAYVLHKQGHSYSELAEKYGVDRSAFSHRFKKHFPTTDVKDYLKIRHDLFKIWEAKNMEELLNRPLKKESTRQLNGNIITINQILSQESERTGDIQVNIIQILSNALDKTETPQVIDAEYETHTPKQISNDNNDV